ncbi:Aldolase-type TIM barrel [Syntrophomonas zehnderi OL-4]|uniref:Putative pyrophosphorylase ModD n=1 Tax=Syntrophomonas zehnderi OL-4 TaxID=690567 RepID=A0A0E3W332_9FIRM|nr:ModD protein [Syntrophomonas zehnderi]CFX45022.1 Aldolase-type TIM barrel [Syntrophomonas zehnderi OL-4]
MYISDESLERFIHEDVPYLDLTTVLLDIGQTLGKISFATREKGVICGCEEADRIFSKLGAQTDLLIPSGTMVEPGQPFLEATGKASSLHYAWKVCLNILEYCSGIASRTRTLLDKARNVNPDINILSTRKMFPGTRELAIKSVIAGGGFPHRLGLSETVLIFPQHINFLGGMQELSFKIPGLKKQACEKKIIVEVQNLDDALLMAAAGVDGLQFDKLSADNLKIIIEEIKTAYPKLLLIAAGGIKETNVVEYAATGVDGIVTTSMYFGRPLDISATMQPI